jgi:hypothetical protein
MTEDERNLARWILSSTALIPARDAVAVYGIDPHRAEFIFRTWEEKGWYEIGIKVDMGHITELGYAEMPAAMEL